MCVYVGNISFFALKLRYIYSNSLYLCIIIPLFIRVWGSFSI